MTSVKLLYQLAWAKLRQFRTNYMSAWVSGLFAASILLPLCLVGSCKEETGLSVPGVGQIYAASFQAQGKQATKIHISKTMIKAYKRQVRGVIKDSHNTILNLQKGEVFLLFDSPDLARNEGTVSSWHYRNAQCVLDIFFERKDKNAKNNVAGTEKVTYYEIRPRRTAMLISTKAKMKEQSESDRKKCLGSLLDKNNHSNDLPAVVVSSIQTK